MSRTKTKRKEPTTTIRLLQSTKGALDKFGIFGESYDQLVLRLLQEVQKIRGNTK